MKFQILAVNEVAYVNIIGKLNSEVNEVEYIK